MMAKNYNWRIKREDYNLIINGTKTLEVRVGYPDIKIVQKGDTITFSNYSDIKFEVVRVARYIDFPEMLDSENSSKAIPGITKYQALGIYQKIYSEDEEALGVYVFELRKQSQFKIISLSSLIYNHKLFSKYVNLSYCVTDHICKDYPNFFEWYWAKQIPRVLNGSGEIVICTVGNDIAGVVFLKKEDAERKICTIYVSKKYRTNSISTLLLERSFEYLGTTKPLIEIPSYKVSMFEHIIKKYHWEHTETLSQDCFSTNSLEFVFNGKHQD